MHTVPDRMSSSHSNCLTAFTGSMTSEQTAPCCTQERLTAQSGIAWSYASLRTQLDVKRSLSKTVPVIGSRLYSRSVVCRVAVFHLLVGRHNVSSPQRLADVQHAAVFTWIHDSEKDLVLWRTGWKKSQSYWGIARRLTWYCTTTVTSANAVEDLWN